MNKVYYIKFNNGAYSRWFSNKTEVRTHLLTLGYIVFSDDTGYNMYDIDDTFEIVAVNELDLFSA